jgi:hypothetical protein
VLGLVVWPLTERPEEAAWLTDDEKRIIHERVSGKCGTMKFASCCRR